MLNADEIHTILLKCLFENDEIKNGAPKDFIKVVGITTSVGLHPKRVEEHTEKIKELLRELPDSFHQNKGGGMSFLNACEDSHGNQWTGSHKAMEELFILGMAINAVKECMPREMWDVLPGGMPYYIVDVEQVQVQEK